MIDLLLNMIVLLFCVWISSIILVIGFVTLAGLIKWFYNFTVLLYKALWDMLLARLSR